MADQPETPGAAGPPKIQIEPDWKSSVQREKAQGQSTPGGADRAQQAPSKDSKIHIDSDWKAEAQKEKERLAKKEQERSAGPAGKAGAAGRGAHDLPEPSFKSLVGMLASQAIMGLGALADPQSNRVVIDLEGAKFSIDMLDMLEQKTKGNLTSEEAQDLRQVLAELRARFVQITQLVTRQVAAQQAADAANAPSPAGSGA